MRRTAFRRMFNERPITWLLRDEFSDTRAAGAVDGTMPTPGPGDRVVVADTGPFISVSNDALNMAAAGAFGNAIIRLKSVTRIPGVFAVFGIIQNGTSSFELGFSESATASRPVRHCLEIAATTLKAWTGGGNNNYAAATVTANSLEIIVLVLRSSGYVGLAKIDNDKFLLYWIDTAQNSGTMHLIASNNGATVAIPFARISADVWLPTPLVSDGFGSSFGTTDGLGHAETSGIGSGGGNVTWTQQVGTWTVSSAKAAADTLSGGIAVATVPLSTADVFAKVKVTRSAGAGGMVLRWTDSSNHLYTEHDGTNAYLKQVLSGSTTTLITAAATYSAGAEIVADLNGVNGRLYWNSALVGSTGSINSGLTATLHGLRSTDTGGIQLDDFVVYAKGTGGEYNLLNRYVNL